MIDFKCKMCGGALNVPEGKTVVTCEFCETTQTIPVFDDEKKLSYYNRANLLRMNSEFDKAAGIYETIVTEFPNEAEAYWGLVLCKYGIEYVTDPRTGNKVPTCHRTLFGSIFDDLDYLNAVKYSDVVSRDIYESEAKSINAIQKRILEISSKEEPFDIFICYKESDSLGNRTHDSVLAFDIYNELKEKGYKVFFSRVSLENKIGVEYEPYIFAALYSAKIMLVVTTSNEHAEAVWVKNEWKRYLSLIKNGAEKTIVTCFKNMSASELPTELQSIQGIDMSKLGSMQDLIYGIDKIMGYSKTNSNDSARERYESKSSYEYSNRYEEDARAKNARILEASYKKYVSELLDIDSFCSYASDILPIIEFFESAIDYKDSKRYLDEAKLAYAKRVNSYSEALQGLIYLDDIPHIIGVDKVADECKQKAIKFRTKELQNQGYAVPDCENNSIYCFCTVLAALVDTKPRQNSKEFNDLDRGIIMECEEKGLAFVDNIGLQVIEGTNVKSELTKVRELLRRASELPLSNLSEMVARTEEKISLILQKEAEKARKEKTRKIIKTVTAISVIAVIALIIAIVSIVKNNGYKPENFTVQVVSKTNDKYNETSASGYTGAGFFYTFEFHVTNNSPHTMQSFYGIMDINNANGQTLATSTISLNGPLEAGKKGTWDVQVNVDKGANAVEIWNSDITQLEIKFRIYEIVFENGKLKKYDNTVNEVVHECTSDAPPPTNDTIISSTPAEEDTATGGGDLLNAIRRHVGNDAIIPDNYESADYNVPGVQCYSYYDGKYYSSYHANFHISEENGDTFLDDFVNKLISNGYTLRDDEPGDWEYVKNDTVIHFGNVQPSYTYSGSSVEYYYFNYYAYKLSEN